jgi:molecular chaperone Hsp33
VSTDLLHRFIFDNAPIRGEWVQLQDSWQEILKRRSYPAAIQHALGEMLAAAALLTETVKIDGRLVLQIRSEGPVKVLMVECTSEHTVRAVSQWDGDIDDEMSLSDLCPNGTLAITIEMEGSKQPYQGVVSVQESLTASLEMYFAQSEQLPTKIWLFANDAAASGLFLQQLPSESASTKEDDAEDWNRITHLASTVTADELLSLNVEELLNRLYHEEEVRLFDGTDIEFACTCSRERVSESLRLIGQEEVEEILEQDGEVTATCDFCNETYRFDPVDVAELFKDGHYPDADSTTIH